MNVTVLFEIPKYKYPIDQILHFCITKDYFWQIKIDGTLISVRQLKLQNQCWLLIFADKTIKDTRYDFEDLVYRKNTRKHVKLYGLVSFTVILSQ